MQSLKVLDEELEFARNKAKSIYETARVQGRELSATEKIDFDHYATEARQFKQAVANEQERRREMVTSMSPAAAWGGDPELRKPQQQLPTNGVPVGESRPEVFPATVRAAKLKAFKDEKTAFACGVWLKAFVNEVCHGRRDTEAAAYCSKLGWHVSNAGAEGTGPTGGFVVPTPLSQTIIDVRETVGITRRACKIMPMTSETLDVPKRVDGLTVYGGGEAPANDMTASDKTWSQIELLAKKRYVVHQISQELQDDAIIPIVDDAVNEMAYALAAAEDAEFINGDGTSPYRMVEGIASKIGSAGVIDCASGHDTWAEIDIADIMKVMGSLPSRFNRNTAWICSNAFYYEVLLRLAAEAGGNGMANLISGPDGGPGFLGRPVYLTDEMPTTSATATVAAYYGSFEMATILGDRTGIRFGRSDDYAFLRDVTTLKATSRYDIKVHEPGDDTNAGAYVALKTAS